MNPETPDHGDVVTATSHYAHVVWEEDPAEDQRLLASSVALVEFARTCKTLHPRHPKRLVSEAIWFWSERGSPANKYRLRYRTPAAIELQATLGHSASAKLLAHEHVHERAALVQTLLDPTTDPRRTLLASHACVVTRAEHAALSAQQHLTGWARYEAAGICPVDMSTGQPVLLPELMLADESGSVGRR
ncbi:hypothetical protein ACOCJ4_16430 [Knoellia sp. CPCC 206435]|uniref:hypothetical protein n=1 Tax=Knoellia terrae TaxID=3404797 RepID=UPI003B42F2DF